ncbi:DUF6266 family protein [Pedobacter gandavensis]|uniref:Uncharacterized protein n=1 Tax=Pedobacter gandavensis TaxID=2679963 RepID=A0ABR6ES01_9SPHI|nr:DUF6266 family protein [Pedobacter gandavensis]MBB2147982.1 hypothetical protein [Pedobacter gandavensis]
MGSLKNGLFGGFHGRVGNLVGYELNGKNVIRTIGHSTKPLSPARKINCNRMTIVNEFLRPINTFIKLGFKLKVLGTDRNYYNEAVSYNKKHAVTGEYPNAFMDYPKAMLSMGTLLKAEKPQIQLMGTAIEFSWDVPADLPWRNRNDRAMLLLYWPDQNQQTHCLSGSHRIDGKHRLEIDPSLANERVEAYISFISDDASEISDSVYAGSLEQKNELELPGVAQTEFPKKEGGAGYKEPQQKSPVNAQIPDTTDHPQIFNTSINHQSSSSWYNSSKKQINYMIATSNSPYQKSL